MYNNMNGNMCGNMNMRGNMNGNMVSNGLCLATYPLRLAHPAVPPAPLFPFFPPLA